ncbi:MAG: thiolase family protein, partial [Planctomycetaceae bacterium]|nr:thiolase family protein [Planctomycetaceae bacterium]
MSMPYTKLDPPLAIVAGKRTPFVKAFGAISGVAADQLGVMAIRGSLAEIGMKADEIDEVVMGNVCGQSDAPNIARVIALRSGIPQDRIAHTVNRNCASGMEAVFQAAQIIRDGRADVIVAGGTESMSQVPFLFNDEAKKWFMQFQKAKKMKDKIPLLIKLRPALFKPVPLLQLGLTDPTCAMNMGETAEGVADDFEISRNAQDAFAVESHSKAIKAQSDGFFNEELVLIPGGITGSAPLQEDLGPRKKQSMEDLGKLRPFFRRKTGTVTVGNSCPITDGAVSLVVMS